MNIVTLGFAARRNRALVWYSDRGMAAHLMSDETTTLCGYTVGELEEAVPWKKRCGNCKNRLKSVLEAALEEQPGFLREVIRLEIVRPVKENMEPIEEVLQRKLRNNTSWTIQTQVLETPEAISSTEVEGQLVFDMAWDERHGAGFHTVESMYEDIARIVELSIKEVRGV